MVVDPWLVPPAAKAVASSGPFWTVSYRNATTRSHSRAMAVRASMGKASDIYQYAAGARGDPMFSQISDENVLQHVRLKQQLRALSTAHREGQSLHFAAGAPDLSRFLAHVDSASVVSEHARASSVKPLEPSDESPLILGHLVAPPMAPPEPELDFSLPERLPPAALEPAAAVVEPPLPAPVTEASPEAPAQLPTIRRKSSSSSSKRGVAAAAVPGQGAVRLPGAGVRDEAPDFQLQDEDESSFSFSEEEEEYVLPRAPILRFRGVVQFGMEFKGGNALKEIKDNVTAITDELNNKKAVDVTDDVDIRWFNKRFETAIKTDLEASNAFPIMLLLILDSIYPNKVRWYQVDWRYRYDTSTARNWKLLLRIWDEVDMDKARLFRVTETSLRIEDMETAPFKQKLCFLSLIKTWYFARMHTAPLYSPQRRLHDIVNGCFSKGYKVELPPWMCFDKDSAPQLEDHARVENAAYRKMPEFKRLIWFKGCPDIMDM